MIDKLKDIVSSQLGCGEDGLGENTAFSSLDCDEFDIVDIVMSIEDEFGFSLEDEEIESLETFGDLVRFVERKL